MRTMKFDCCEKSMMVFDLYSSRRARHVTYLISNIPKLPQGFVSLDARFKYPFIASLTLLYC